MKRYIALSLTFILFFTISTSVYVYFKFLKIDIESISSEIKRQSSDINIAKVQTLRFPNFGVSLKDVQYSPSSILNWTAKKLDLEINFGSAIYSEYLVEKFTINGMKIKINGNLTSWLKSLTPQNIMKKVGLKGLASYKKLAIIVNDASLTLNDNKFSNLSVQIGKIEHDEPYSINLAGIWNDKQFKISSLVNVKDSIISFENSHLKVYNINDNPSIANININSDIFYDFKKNHLNFKNLVIMAPEVRAQGNVKVIDGKSHGALDIPPAPCQDILQAIGYKFDIFEQCQGKLNWDDRVFQFKISDNSSLVYGNFNLSKKTDVGNIINIQNINLASILNSKIAKQILFEWFQKINFKNSQFNPLSCQKVLDSKFTCKINNKDYDLHIETSSPNKAILFFKQIPADLLKESFKTDIGNIQGNISGKILFEHKSIIFDLTHCNIIK